MNQSQLGFGFFSSFFLSHFSSRVTSPLRPQLCSFFFSSSSSSSCFTFHYWLQRAKLNRPIERALASSLARMCEYVVGSFSLFLFLFFHFSLSLSLSLSLFFLYIFFFLSLLEWRRGRSLAGYGRSSTWPGLGSTVCVGEANDFWRRPSAPSSAGAGQPRPPGNGQGRENNNANQKEKKRK